MKSLKDYESFSETPFKVRGLKIVSTRNKTEDYVVPDTGEEVKILKPSEEKVSDTKEYRKVFTEALDIIRDLSSPAVKLLCYILLNCKPKKDYVILEQSKVLLYCGYSSRNSFYTPICELLEKGVIAKSTGGDAMFFINVNFIFNGDRKDLIDQDQIYRNEQQT